MGIASFWPGVAAAGGTLDDSANTDSTDVAPVPAEQLSDWGDELGHAPERRVRLEGSERNVVRSGPGSSYALVAVCPQGANYRVLAKHDDWYNIELGPSESGWIHSSLCREYDDLSDLELRVNPRLYSRIGAFTMTGWSGGYSFDRKSNSLAVGGRLGYYLLDFVEVGGGVGWTHVRRPAEIVESLFDLSLESEDFQILFYALDLRLELLPGRRVVPYLTGGLGSTLLQGRSERTTSLGAGTLFFLGKRSAMRTECRDHRFESGIGRARRLNNNIEFSIGASALL